MFAAQFQSTLPVGGATWLGGTAPWWPGFQSTLPVGGATSVRPAFAGTGRFQSTLPVGGATAQQRTLTTTQPNFNPRSPWGERRDGFTYAKAGSAFQSTLPVGGATLLPAVAHLIQLFQSTLPVGGATAKMHKFPAASLAKVSNFVGQAPGKAVPNRFKSRYSPHRFTKKPCEPPGNSCSPELRTTGSGYPPADRCSCSRNAQPFFHIDSPGSRSGGCPFPDP